VLRLTILPESFAIWKLPTSAPLPQVAFFAAIRTGDELSLVTEDALAPNGVPCERGWRALRVAGPLDFSLTGILASLATPLAEAKIPIYALSTFETDYVFVKEATLAAAITALENAGHDVVKTPAR
jgi:uncharacterized protein